MVHHHARIIHNKRQDVPAAPTALGLTAASVAVNTAAITQESLAIDTNAVTNAGQATAVVAFSAAATATTSVLAVPTVAADPANATAQPSAAAGASKSDISIGTVIGACVGALLGAIIIVLLGLWLFRRGSQVPVRRPSNAHKGDKERAWAKMEDSHDDDKWEGKDEGVQSKYQKNGVVSVPPMEKLTMFKKGTPSMWTNYTTFPEPPAAQFDHPFAAYHPNLAKDMAQADSQLPASPQPFLPRVEVPSISWDGDTVAHDSFLSLKSNSSPPMSASADFAIPTPQLTSSEPHLWHSVEIEDFDTRDPARASSIAEPILRRKSLNNPFFGASERVSMQSARSRTPSLSRANHSVPDPVPVAMPAIPASAWTREEKGKYRVSTPPSPTSSVGTIRALPHRESENPFSDPSDEFVAPMIRLPFAKPEHHSQASQDHALASLIAALGPSASADDVQERLRVSMQPSIASVSSYTDGDNETLHQSWPVPPNQH
ncbi:unnamed protein product [Mycena citricolor]|uniref:Uncharacterized protein n=1 Tax=Mycena citricolor TaxID=2018698 RepID=A0AAD2H3X9_9AGAR|nr:unnamed protein product [Mycena citricolor]